MPLNLDSLVDGVRQRDVRAMARAITIVESEGPEAHALVAGLYARTGAAYVIGVTGPPGAGKSTLVDQLIALVRQRGSSVGVIAVDPTSPFSGGAILGDRIRMGAHAGDAGVFVRSMATRGQLGGLARAAADAVVVLDAAGLDVIIVETVGVGQDEVDVAEMADVSIVVLVPGAGDDVQAIKAGIMEIADVFVVNKADRDGAERMVQSIEMNLSLQAFGAGDWRPPVLKTVASEGTGVDDVWNAIERFRTHPDQSRAARQRQRVEARLRQLVAAAYLRHVERVVPREELEAMIDRMVARELDPYAAAESLLRATVAKEVPAPPRDRADAPTGTARS